MTEIEFIQDGPVLENRTRELESSRARSFAARVSHARKRRKNGSIRSGTDVQSTVSGFSSRSASSDEEPSPVEKVEGQSIHPAKYSNRALRIQQLRKHLIVSQAITATPMSNQQWTTSEQRLAYDHWRSVTAPWSAQFHASIGSNFWQAVVLQMAELFSPVKNIVLALEFIDLPAFQGEALAERREKTIGFYNNEIRSLYKISWPRICIITFSFLAYALELRWNHVEKARIHLASCQKLLADADQNPEDSKSISEFVQDIKDIIYYGNSFVRLSTRVEMLQKSVKCSSPEYGINAMPDSSDSRGNLQDYLTRFQQSMDEIYASMSSNLHSFDVSEAMREYDHRDDLVHRLCQQRKIGNTTATVSMTLTYIQLFLIPCTQDGIFGMHPDPVVWDHILLVFKDQLQRSLSPQERQDVNMVVRLGLAAILRFPHQPRHAVEIESMHSLMVLGEMTSSMQALHTTSSHSSSSFEMV